MASPRPDSDSAMSKSAKELKKLQNPFIALQRFAEERVRQIVTDEDALERHRQRRKKIRERLVNRR